MDMDGCDRTSHYCQKVSPARDLTELIGQLHQAFEGDEVDIDYVKEIMSSYKSNPKEWSKFAKFDEYRYTRNLVDEGNGKFNLIVLCWNEAQGSSIHDHADSHCFMKVLDGQLNEVLFDWPKEGQEMNERCTHNYETDQVTYICDGIGLHRVENASFTDKAVSLHLYSPPFMQCGSFDQRTGHKNNCKVTFYSKYGTRTPYKPSSCDPAAAHSFTDQENN